MALLPSPLNGVVFDMDGLLLDSEGPQKRTMLSVATDLGFTIPDDLLLGMVGVDRATNRASLHRSLGAAFPLDEFYAQVDSRFEEMVVAGLPLRPGALLLLDALDEFSIPRAIATSTAAPYAQQRLEFAGILDRFDAVITFSDVQHPKPAPDPYLKAAAALSSQPRQCLALDDSPNGVRSAVAAGLVTIMIPNLLRPSRDLREQLAAVLDSLADVAAILRAELTEQRPKRV